MNLWTCLSVVVGGCGVEPGLCCFLVLNTRVDTDFFQIEFITSA